jgi:hydroxymethylbilane synthase
MNWQILPNGLNLNTPMPQTIKLGTRQSVLALQQAETIKKRLLEAFPELTIIIVPIKTAGDINQSQPLIELGGKGVFIKAIEDELLKGTIDCAVHCLKDVTSHLHPDTTLSAFCHAEAVTDCIIMANNTKVHSLDQLPKKITMATSSLRRKLLLNHYRPDIIIKPIRGNIDTRIQKCLDGYADGVMLASAGLIRLNRESEISMICDPTCITPAPGQGVVVIQSKRSDTHLDPYLNKLDSPSQRELSLYEQAVIETIGISCDYPLGIYATKEAETISLHACWSDATCATFNHRIIHGNHNTLMEKIKKLSTDIKTSLNISL